MLVEANSLDAAALNWPPRWNAGSHGTGRNTAHSALEDGSLLRHSFATAVSSDGSGGTASVLETAQASRWSGVVLRHVLPFRIKGLTGGMQLVQQRWLRYGRFTTHCWNPLFGWSALLPLPSCPTMF